jgi:hypothetical protein
LHLYDIVEKLKQDLMLLHEGLNKNQSITKINDLNLFIPCNVSPRVITS